MVSILGIVPIWTADRHKKYGEVVRLGPGRLSYTHPRAWKEDYGHRVGTSKPGVKDKKFAAYQPEYNGEDTIISTLDDGEHGAIRKIFSHAFSDRALKEQESLIRKYTDVLIENVPAERVNRRMEKGSDKPDIWNLVLEKE